ncbi:hypothetical protein CC85DRAFT_305170 [Cutaneotrichosporon oleaginosum]|uniref:PIN domain-containing protein n=1 Tax=Cutaneotrichosporon oleaginosum TaxID=879819 RepID=A0A0J1AVK5_9TREE|nr:uncharacterized protein CC85DRAFT_305170 [Cutaneotrichosporon oleaginosum]KLT39319.1 hypothetical protein CC85DRAFT_305170 [Cutaneotrichosporon oleaginosum]TXT08577.1 hypothetical protein COLE_05501 [Cutaneotrichosporon oleaginosum]
MEWEPNGAPIDTSPSTSSFHSPVNGSNGTAAAAAGPAANGATLFISLDTNVLIDQLSVVSEVHARLISAGSTTYLLVGQQAVNELDGLSKSTRSDLAAAAREATLWLDTTIRGPRVGRASRLRIESRAERIAAALDTHEGVGIQAREDDAILSCCIWFGRAAPVLLWTHDRNLAVLAEGSAVRTLVGRAGALRLLREAGVALDADEGMELDVEIAASDAISHARAIAARLDDLDSPDKPVDLRRALVRAFAHARKFAAYLAGDPERVRAGEAANALLIVAQELGRLMPLDKNAWAAAAAQVRQLP